VLNSTKIEEKIKTNEIEMAIKLLLVQNALRKKQF